MATNKWIQQSQKSRGVFVQNEKEQTVPLLEFGNPLQLVPLCVQTQVACHYLFGPCTGQTFTNPLYDFSCIFQIPADKM